MDCGVWKMVGTPNLDGPWGLENIWSSKFERKWEAPNLDGLWGLENSGSDSDGPWGLEDRGNSESDGLWGLEESENSKPGWTVGFRINWELRSESDELWGLEESGSSESGWTVGFDTLKTHKPLNFPLEALDFNWMNGWRSRG